MCRAMSFDASFDCEQTFLVNLLPKFVKKYVCLTFRDSSKNFVSGFTKKKSELGFVLLTRLTEEAVESIRSVVDRWSGQGTL